MVPVGIETSTFLEPSSGSKTTANRPEVAPSHTTHSSSSSDIKTDTQPDAFKASFMISFETTSSSFCSSPDALVPPTFSAAAPPRPAASGAAATLLSMRFTALCSWPTSAGSSGSAACSRANSSSVGAGPGPPQGPRRRGWSPAGGGCVDGQGPARSPRQAGLQQRPAVEREGGRGRGTGEKRGNAPGRGPGSRGGGTTPPPPPTPPPTPPAAREREPRGGVTAAAPGPARIASPWAGSSRPA